MVREKVCNFDIFLPVVKFPGGRQYVSPDVSAHLSAAEDTMIASLIVGISHLQQSGSHQVASVG